MNPQSKGIAASLARAWGAVVKAFTPTRETQEQDLYGSDTTLFGPGPDPTGASSRSARGKPDFWNAGEDSSYFADQDEGGKDPRR
jgi:hypothetical protein